MAPCHPVAAMGSGRIHPNRPTCLGSDRYGLRAVSVSARRNHHPPGHMAWHTAFGLAPGPRTPVAHGILRRLLPVHSERASCEELKYNLLFHWFLDMDLLECSFDATVFTKNRPRRRAHDAGRAMFNEVVLAAHAEGLLSDVCFSVDGPPPPAANDAHGFPSVEFQGTRQSHAAHTSTTDPEAWWRRKGRSREAKLMFAGHALTGTATGCRWTSQSAGQTGMRNGRWCWSF